MGAPFWLVYNPRDRLDINLLLGKSTLPRLPGSLHGRGSCCPLWVKGVKVIPTMPSGRHLGEARCVTALFPEMRGD